MFKPYQIAGLFASGVTLGLAFLSKYYTGPYHHFSDAYLGDVFIVMCLYFWLSLAMPRISVPRKIFAIAAVSCSVELLQLSGWPASLNLPEPFVFILGTSYDPQDFIFYAIGLSLAAALDVWLIKFRVPYENI